MYTHLNTHLLIYTYTYINTYIQKYNIHSHRTRWIKLKIELHTRSNKKISGDMTFGELNVGEFIKLPIGKLLSISHNSFSV